MTLITATGSETVAEQGREVTRTAGGIGTGLLAATALMIVFSQRYPHWWFDFS